MRTVVTALGLGLFVAVTTASATPWATDVVSYDPGTGPASEWGTGALFTNASAALGPVTPETGYGPVTMFNAPYEIDEVVSVGVGGSLVLRLGTPAVDRPGADFIVYANTGFVDPIWDDATLDIGSPASLYGADGGIVEVSADGVNWALLAGDANGVFPTQPWLDTASTVPARFGKPLPAGLTQSDFDGLAFEQALALYDGSAGGTAFDIASTGWDRITYVRVAYDGDFNAEIDAVRVVPEPGTLALLALGALALVARCRG